MTGKTKKIRVESICHSVDQKEGSLAVLQNIDFYAEEGEIVSILGPSGCGKSTFLNMLSGLYDPNEGTILVDEVVTEAKDRIGRIGYMQQKDMLLPWRTVLDNVVIGLEIKGVSRNSARNMAISRLDEFGLAGFENQYPFVLSGGMRQRAAFLRTMLMDSSVVLLDEPFSSLDSINRMHLQSWLLELLNRYSFSGRNSKTVILVTHDVEEALFLSDRIYVMSSRPGQITLVESVDFGRKIITEMVNDPSFVQMKSRLTSYLLDEQVGKLCLYLTAF